MSGRVIVVGSSNTDLVVHTSKLPLPGETVVGGDMQVFAGGKGANQAVATARSGAKTIFIGAFGDDDFGRARRKELEAAGVDCSRCVTKKGVPSGVALIGIGEGAKHAKAENLILVAPGANMRLSAADVKHGLPRDLNKNDVILSCLEVPLDASLQAFKAGARRGAMCVLNPAPWPSDSLASTELKQLLQYVHWLTPNESEFTGLTGIDSDRASIAKPLARWFKKCHKTDGALRLTITRGSKGAQTFELSNVLIEDWTRAPKVKPVDTVGAGDCFNGALAAQLAAGRSEKVALTFAVAAASLKVTRHGAQAGIPHQKDVLKLLKV